MNTVLEKIKNGNCTVVVIENDKVQCRWRVYFAMENLPVQR